MIVTERKFSWGVRQWAYVPEPIISLPGSRSLVSVHARPDREA